MDNQRKVIALGFFDGVHMGHGALLRTVAERAGRLDAVPCAFTFDRSPAAAVTGRTVPLLTGVEDRARMMEELYGIQEVIVAPFAVMRQMDWRDFVGQYLQKELGVVHVVAGHDFHFGYKGEGTPRRLEEKCRELGMGCDIIPAVRLEGVTVSSTHIRALLEKGETEEAARFLGRPFAISGTVRQGKHLGTSRLGAPTVNLIPDRRQLVPAFGVYVSRVQVNGGVHPAVTNVGVRPTVDTDGGVTVESHLLGGAPELYGADCRVEFLRMLRPEKRFVSLDVLREQIARDAAAARNYFLETR